MNRNKFVAIAVHALVAATTVSFTLSPVVVAAQSPTPDPAPLAASIASAAIGAEAASKGLDAVKTHDAIMAAMEQAIAISGVDPTTALAALTLTQTNMQAAGTLTPAIAAALADLIAKVQAAIKVQETPGATGGRNGGSPFGASSGGGGGGGSDYRGGA